jgi:hypothetical protein
MLRRLLCAAAVATALVGLMPAAAAVAAAPTAAERAAVAAAARTPVPATAAPPAAPADVDLAVRDLAADRGISLGEAQRRIGWQRLAPDLARDAAARLGDRFGGVWIDTADNDRVKIGVVGWNAGDGAAAWGDAAVRGAAAAKGLAAAVDPVAVRHSLAELERGNAWLAGRLVAVNAGAGATLTAGIRPDRNAVELQLPAAGTLTAAQRGLVDEARLRLGSALLVGAYAGRATARACAYPYCDPPLRGGIRITNSGRGCTGAFIARSRVDSALYQFTAGHCVAGGFTDSWSTRFTNGSTHVVGPRHNSRFASNGDMAILRINNPAGWTPRAWVYVTAGPDTTTDTTYHLSSDGASTVGMRICTTGAFFGRSDCGTVTQLGVTATYGGVTVTGLGRGSFCGTGGDSGAPMYASHVAFGLQTAGFSQCDSLYQGITAAENAMNVNVLHATS